MTWTIQIGGAELKPAASPPFPVLDRGPVSELVSKLTNAVRIASEMASAAKTAVKKFAVVPQGQEMHMGHAEVMDALIKYFNLHPSNQLYARTTERIVDVFRAIKTGLAGRYTLYIFTAPTPNALNAGVQGYCRVDTKANLALGQLFLRGDHIDWSEMQRLAKGNRSTAPSEDIHLKYEFLVREPADVIARTIVHEASHKWAYTTDVCYKHNTLAKNSDDLQLDVKRGYQPAERRFADYSRGNEEQKPLYPMVKKDTSVPNKGPLVPIVGENKMKLLHMPGQLEGLSKSDMWVKNADSYAYVARRLWKKEPIIASAASGGRCASLNGLKTL